MCTLQMGAASCLGLCLKMRLPVYRVLMVNNHAHLLNTSHPRGPGHVAETHGGIEKSGAEINMVEQSQGEAGA